MKREEAPDGLRHLVLHSAKECGLSSSTLRDIACAVTITRPNAVWPNEIWDEAEGIVYQCDWFKVYDLAEKLHQALSDRNLNSGERFQAELNHALVEMGMGWQMVDGKIVTRGGEDFEAVFGGAIAALKESGRVTALNEIREARRSLSRRPEPDLTGAVMRAMAALECVARDVCGDQKLTLGQIRKRYPGAIPPPLDEAIEKTWGYASNTARHLSEGRTIERPEVELVVSLAATVVTYLATRSPPAKPN